MRHQPLTMQNTLPFGNVGDITFTPSGQDLKIYVSGQLLGTFNSSSPATVFITQNGSNKAITFKQISQSAYMQGNTGTPGADTIYFNPLTGNSKIEACSGGAGCFKLTGIGWEDDDYGQTCTGGSKGFTNLFNISAEGQLKAKFEQVSINGSMQIRLVARYSGNVMCKQTPATAICCNDNYCYYCNE
ncbi:MAG TPA: hypothetical protein PKC38_02090 [Chitinophagales bacterium]|nr:hypothetical protein [Chitinophagales bacterium]